MASKTPTYRKLPGKKKNFLMGIHRLWAARDHLLQVHSRVGTEQYQRFYFKDIQALITRKTAVGKIYNVLLAAITLLLFIPAINLGGGASVFFYCSAAFFLIILLINWALGPTCRTFIKTAVQQETLPSLHRLRNATRVMNQLMIPIRAEQGKLSGETLLQGLRQLRNNPPASSNSPKAQSPAPDRTPGAAKPEGRLHIYLMILLFARAFLGLSEFYANHMALAVFDMGVFLTLFIMAIVCLVRQYDPPRHRGMLAVAWATVAYVGLSAISGYVIFIGMAFKNPNAMFNQWKQIEQVSRLSPHDNAVLFGLQVFFVIFAVLLGILIFIASRSKAAGLKSGFERPGRHYQARPNGRI